MGIVENIAPIPCSYMQSVEHFFNIFKWALNVENLVFGDYYLADVYSIVIAVTTNPFYDAD